MQTHFNKFTSCMGPRVLKKQIIKAPNEQTLLGNFARRHESKPFIGLILKSLTTSANVVGKFDDFVVDTKKIKVLMTAEYLCFFLPKRQFVEISRTLRLSNKE